jgi:hypothetical protein
MRRLMIILPIVVAFAAGWTLASGRAPIADARPKPTCKDDLVKTRRELASAIAESSKMKAAVEEILARERKRVEALEQALSGEPIRDLK